MPSATKTIHSVEFSTPTIDVKGGNYSEPPIPCNSLLEQGNNSLSGLLKENMFFVKKSAVVPSLESSNATCSVNENCIDLPIPCNSGVEQSGVSFNGLPKDTKMESVIRCIQLLEHAENCLDPSKCTEGECCRRTRQVLDHHGVCPEARKLLKMEAIDCSICRQLVALCQIHAAHCEKPVESCLVPYCPNKKTPELPRKNQAARPKIPPLKARKEEYRQVLNNLLHVMRLSSPEEKKQRIQEMLNTNRNITTHLLKQIYFKKIQMTAEACGKPLAVVKPTKNAGRASNVGPYSCQMEVASPPQDSDTEVEDNKVHHWFARVKFLRVND